MVINQVVGKMNINEDEYVMNELNAALSYSEIY
jgi:hypothetical protein